MEQAEQAYFRLIPGVDMGKLKTKFVFIKLAGEDLAVRAYIYNDDRDKKTLVMTHGYGMSCIYFAHILPALAEHYRIVMFDNLAWGLNTRTQNVGDAFESPEKGD